MGVDFIGSWQSSHDAAAAMISGDDPFFLGRIGGSDTDAVIDYVACGRPNHAGALSSSLIDHLAIIERYNGYYDKSRSPEKYLNYCATLLDGYTRCTDLVMCGAKLLTTYFPGVIDSRFHEKLPLKESVDDIISYIESAQGSVRFYPYNFVERLVFGTDTLFRAFERTLSGKKVLVVSPFSKSINTNFHNRHNFFKNYDYPDFEISTINTPITYSGLPDDFYPHDDWFQTTAYLKSELSDANFDIALLSCGSYAIPLGVHIRDNLQKQAIYVGGVLQLYFGIMGRRYDNIFFTDQINQDKFIYPVESADYMRHVTLTPGAAKEAFGAYF